MPQLLFKREFFDAIRRGRKTTTLRRWKSCWLEAGARAFSPGLGWLRIVSCEGAKLEKLTAADARADGFASLAKLHATLARLYPDQKRDGKQWYRVVFELERDGQAPVPTRLDTRRGGGLSRHPTTQTGRGQNEHQKQKTRLARRIRVELDKAVQRSGSLFPL
jgi:hypothetical protein